MLIERTFKHGDVAITVQKPTGLTRVRKWNLGQELVRHGDLSEEVNEMANTALFLLANTRKVDGELEFPVPTDNPTPERLIAFIEGLGNADETLLLKWDNTVLEARYATNDEDLLPPEDTPKKS